MKTDNPDQAHDLLRLYFNQDYSPVLEVSSWLVGIVIVIVLIVAIVFWQKRHRFEVVNLEIPLGGIGKVQLRPREADLDIAHKIWTELVTRKAAIPFDPENDVIAEVYDSWYTLFGRVRELISEIPARSVRNDKNTRELVRIATESLNKGLRPHLTKWQARFRNWYSTQHEALESKTPQEAQREYPEYNTLVKELKLVNEEMIQYAEQLKKLVHGK